jgi:hypothetical protein
MLGLFAVVVGSIAQVITFPVQKKLAVLPVGDRTQQEAPLVQGND